MGNPDLQGQTIGQVSLERQPSKEGSDLVLAEQSRAATKDELTRQATTLTDDCKKMVEEELASPEDELSVEVQSLAKEVSQLEAETHIEQKHFGVEIVSAKVKKQEGKYLLESIITEADRKMTRPKPDKPEKFLLDLLIKAGVPEEQATESAVKSAIRSWESDKANAMLVNKYLNAITEGKNPLEISELSEAVKIYEQQFQGMLSLLGIPGNTESKIDQGATIIDSYRARVTPIPDNLTGIIFDEGTQGTINLSEGFIDDGVYGVYFPISAEKDPSNDEGVRIDHSSDHIKVHEDSHFLTLCVKGKDGYFSDMQMGMLGEGIAPIFELWFEGSRQAGGVTFTQESLNSINSGNSPVRLRLAEHTADSNEFWDQAKAEGIIREHSGITQISSEIMALLQANPNIDFPTVFRTFLETETLDDFFTSLDSKKTDNDSFEKFKANVSALTKRARHQI